MNSYNKIFEKINEYETTKEEKALIYKQLTDVLDQIENEKIDDEFTEDLINDIFEYNNIEKVKKSKKISNPNQLFIGIMFIISGLLVIVTGFNLFEIIGVLSALSVIYLLYRKKFFLALLFFGLSSITLLHFNITFLIGLLIAYIGLKIIFFKSNNVTYHKFEQQYQNFNKKYIQGENTYSNSGIDLENQALFLSNNFNGMDFKLVDQKINYMNIKNKFGGCDLDLRSFEFPLGNLVIDVDNYFGGLNILVNKETNVEVATLSTFGGIENTSKNNDYEEKTAQIFVQGNNKFGGITIK